MKNNFKWFVILHIIILTFSVSSICSKMAAQNDAFSIKWIVFYGLVICILGFYAIAWQQVLKHLPLVTAYANKAVTTIWGVIWGALLFGENIKWQNIVGAIVVIFGVYLVVTGEEPTATEESTAEEGQHD